MRDPRTFRRVKERPRQDRRFLMATALVAIVAFLATLSWPQPDVPPQAPSPAAALARMPATSAALFECEVALVNDGDTLCCRDGVKVRLHAVAAREADETCSPGHPCPEASGASATALLSRLAADKTLTCEPLAEATIGSQPSAGHLTAKRSTAQWCAAASP